MLEAALAELSAIGRQLAQAGQESFEWGWNAAVFEGDPERKSLAWRFQHLVRLCPTLTEAETLAAQHGGRWQPGVLHTAHDPEGAAGSEELGEPTQIPLFTTAAPVYA